MYFKLPLFTYKTQTPGAQIQTSKKHNSFCRTITMNQQLHCGVRKFSTGPDQLTVKVKSVSNEEMRYSCKSIFPNASTLELQERNKKQKRSVKQEE